MSLTHEIKVFRLVNGHTSSVLDFSRAVAAGLVVIFHARIGLVGDPEGVFEKIAYSITTCGTQAVVWFFVISGYLVGGSVVSDILKRRFRFRPYLIARMSRLYIVLMPACVLCYTLDWIRVTELGVNYAAGQESAESLSWATVVGNLLFLQTLYVPTLGSNSPLWSLACEFWYYMMFPLLLAPMMINKPKLHRIFLFSIGLFILIIVAYLNRGLAWLFVMWLLGVAARVCPYRFSRSERVLWLIALAVMIGYPSLHSVLGPFATFMVAFTFAIVLVASQASDQTRRWKFERFIRVLSGFSFSLYIIHAPLIHFILTVPWHEPSPEKHLPPFSALTVIDIVLVVGLAYCAAFSFAQLTERHTTWLRRRLTSSYGYLA
jgi:peptidoglycan/LPS O-acetylase OafA/YrhL